MILLTSVCNCFADDTFTTISSGQYLPVSYAAGYYTFTFYPSDGGTLEGFSLYFDTWCWTLVNSTPYSMDLYSNMAGVTCSDSLSSWTVTFKWDYKKGPFSGIMCQGGSAKYYNPSVTDYDPSSVDFTQYSCSIPPGNALIVSGSAISIRDLSVSASGFTWGATKNQAYGFLSSLPTNQNLLNILTNRFDWVGQNPNIVGISSDFSASINDSTGSNYFLIVNPSYGYFGGSSSAWSGMNYADNPTINVSFMNYNKSDVYMVSLSQETSLTDGGTTTYINPDKSITYDSSISGSAISFDDGNGGTPVNRGNDSDTPFINTDDDVSNIIESLGRKIINLLSPGVSAIQNLVNSGSAFFTTLGNLFSWIPSEARSVITSGIIVVAIIGVLKVFL